MILIDTSILVAVLRDRSGDRAKMVLDTAGDREIVLSRFAELELLMGATDEADWQRLSAYISTRKLLEPTKLTWRGAAHIYVDLRRKGFTVRSSIDCCIAQLAIENEIELLHNDRDFDVIASATPLKHLRLDLSKA